MAATGRHWLRYREFAAENRPDGWNASVTFSLSPPAAPPPAPVKSLIAK